MTFRAAHPVGIAAAERPTGDVWVDIEVVLQRDPDSESMPADVKAIFYDVKSAAEFAAMTEGDPDRRRWIYPCKVNLTELMRQRIKGAPTDE